MYSFNWGLEMYRLFLVSLGRAPGVNVQNVCEYLGPWTHYLRSNDNWRLKALKAEMYRTFNIEPMSPRTLKDELLYRCIGSKDEFRALFALNKGRPLLTAMQNDLYS